MLTIPGYIPAADPVTVDPGSTGPDDTQSSTYDVAIGGIGFRYASTDQNPSQWQTAPYVRQQIDQASEAGEQTLSNWWLKSQASFHGGAGNLNLERDDLPPAYTHIRFDKSKNVDVWTPGQLKRLPDASLCVSNEAVSVAPFALSGADKVGFIDNSHNPYLLDVGTSTATALTAVTESCYSITTDGVSLYAAGATGVWKIDPSALTAAKIANYASTTTPTVSWQKARLMVGFNGGIYEIATSGTPPTLTPSDPTLRYQHPTPGWRWRCFASSLPAILAAGDAGSGSDIVEFAVSAAGATPVLAVQATAAEMPEGEHVLSMCQANGSFLAIGTNRGIRVATLGDLYSDTRITIGPLTLPASETQFSVPCVTTRDRFVYAGGLAIDEPGLIRVDLGAQTDQPGRHAYATDLIAPTASAASPVTAVCVLPSGRLLFSVPTIGLCLEGTEPGSLREAWLQTSRIRFATTEPKLFKLGQVRGDLSDSTCRVEGVTRTNSSVLATVGFTLDDPPEFNLPGGGQEWLALKFTLFGADALLTSYQVKALPGTKRQRIIQVQLADADHETDRNGRRDTQLGVARERAEALFALDAAGDVVPFDEYQLDGTVRTMVVIEQATYTQSGRPTRTSDFGGVLTVRMRTVN